METITKQRSATTKGSKTMISPRQIRWALLILLANLVLLFILGLRLPGHFYPWLFGLLFGFVLQRSRFCFAAASRDIFLIRNTMITRALILAFIVSSLGFLLLELLTPEAELLFSQGKLYPVGVFTAVGAFLFGIGMVIAGGCASGMLMRMGEGYMMQWVVMGGFLLGSVVGAWHLGWWYERFIAGAAVLFYPHQLGWPLALLLHFSLLIGLYILACVYQDGWQRPGNQSFKPLITLRSLKNLRDLYVPLLKKPWPYVVGGMVLAVLNTVYFALWGTPWGITSGITFFASWVADLLGFSPEQWYYFMGKIPIDACCLPDLITPDGISYFAFPLTFHFMAIVVGSLLASLLAGEFRIRKWRRDQAARFVPAALVGGVLMGYGSRVALGCNIGAYFSAIPSFSLHGWVFGIFIIVGAYLGGKILLRYLVS